MDNDKPTPGQQVREALLAAGPRPRPQPNPEFVAYMNSLDAMELHIANYLLRDLHVPWRSLPALLALIDSRCFDERLESEVSFVLGELEK